MDHFYALVLSGSLGIGECLRKYPSLRHFLGLYLQNISLHLPFFAPRYAWRLSPAFVSSLQCMYMLCDAFSSQNVMLKRGDICPVWIGSRWSPSGCIRTVVQPSQSAVNTSLPPLWLAGQAHFSWKPISTDGPFASRSEPSLCWHHQLDTAKAGRQVQEDPQKPK